MKGIISQPNLASQIFIEERDHQLALSGQPDYYCWPKKASKGLKSIDIISWPNLATQIFIEERDHQLALSGQPDIYCWPKNASKGLKIIDIISWPNLASQIFIEERDHQLALSGHPDIQCWPKKASKRLKTIDIIILLIYMAYTKAQQMIPCIKRDQKEIKKEDSCYSHFLAKESKIGLYRY